MFYVQISDASRVGCSVRPGCSGYVVVVCLFARYERTIQSLHSHDNVALCYPIHILYCTSGCANHGTNIFSSVIHSVIYGLGIQNGKSLHVHLGWHILSVFT